MSPTARYDDARNTRARARALAGALPSDTRGRLVDFGAGTGWASWALAELGWHVIAIEATPGPLLRERARHPRITLLTGRRTITNVLNLNPDHIIALSVIHHLADPPAALRELLDAELTTTVIEIPHPFEANRREIAGNDHILELTAATQHRPGGQIVHHSPSAFVSGARRPLIVWDDNVTAGTVVTGGGHTTREWDQVGAIVAHELNLELIPGTLNLELDRPLPARPLTEVATKLGPVRFHPVTINNVDAFALRMPRGHDPAGFAELAATTNLREFLELVDGDSVAIRAADPV